jgi:hypothetical protein
MSLVRGWDWLGLRYDGESWCGERILGIRSLWGWKKNTDKIKKSGKKIGVIAALCD